MLGFYKWFYPGMHVKRWFALLFVGLTCVSLGAAYVMVTLYREQPFPEVASYITLQFVDRPIRGVIFALLGLGILAFAWVRLQNSLFSALLPAGQEEKLVDIVYQKRLMRRGPRIVAIGGGTGLSTLLRGLKAYTGNLSAVVTVADDGGSSGKLRRDMGLLPPGDFRQCIVALADAEPLMTQLFQYRFGAGSGLEGHSFGNLFIAAMSEITGNFEQAIRESSRVLAVSGQILPSTLADVTLCAEFEDEIVTGESRIPRTKRPIKRVFLEPGDSEAYGEAVRAILQADLITLGPGSLFTSVLPNLLVRDLAQAIRASGAVRVYVCNIATQEGETDRFDLGDHVTKLCEQVGPDVFDYVLANNNFSLAGALKSGVDVVHLGNGEAGANGHEVVCGDLVDENLPYRHDSAKLAQAIIKLYYDKAQDHNGKKPVLLRTVDGVRSQLR